MSEIELRFQTPAAARDAVEAAVATTTAQRTRLQAIYFDTRDGRLAEAGLALRLRREGSRWVQTLKTGGRYAMERFEHNVELPARTARAGGAGSPDPALHKSTAGGALLAKALDLREDRVAAKLEALFRTDVQRCHRVLRTLGGRVELAFDRGAIVAGDRREPVCELEIELLSGSPSVVVDVARRWVARFGLWLEVRSKAERGERIARSAQALPGPPHRAAALQLDRGTGVDAAFRAVVTNGLEHVLPNLSEVASGTYAEGHVHQLRVGLRRLRTALRFFDGWTALIDPAWAVMLADAFAQLGTTRDRHALTAAVVPDLRSAGAPWVELPAPADAADPVAVARSSSLTQTLLELLGVATRGVDASHVAEGSRFDEQVSQRLAVWHDQVRRDAKRFSELDDPTRHRLRRRVKRLRYATEFVASLYDGKAVARYSKRLEPAQETLGRMNDVNVALALYRGMVEKEPGAWFAVGRLSARREALLGECAAALKEFRRAEPFWGRTD